MDQNMIYIDAMLKRAMGNKTLAITLFEKLFAELPVEIEALALAITQNDILSAKKITHKLQGSFSFCGFLKLETLTKNLENALCSDELKKIQMNFDRLEKEVVVFKNTQENNKAPSGKSRMQPTGHFIQSKACISSSV